MTICTTNLFVISYTHTIREILSVQHENVFSLIYFQDKYNAS